jgi:hypothetical protein
MSARLTSKPYAGAFAALALFFVLVSSAQALTIAPARIEITGDPGRTSTGEIVVTNEEDTGRTFYTSVQNFEARGETGTPNFTDGSVGLASWVTVTDQVVLAPGEKVTVPFSVTIPEGAEPGGHFAAIFLSTVPPSDGAQVAIGAKIGVLILLRVSGEVTEEGGISDFGPLKRFVFSLPVQFSYRFTNTGGDRVNPRGEVTIRNMIGLKTDTFAANPTEGNVLPGSTRKYETSWGDPNEAHGEGFFGALAYEWKHFALGPYFAKLDLAYGVNGEAKESTWFIVLPWHLLTVLLLILVVAFPVFRILVRRYNRWVISKAQQAQ